MRGLFGGGAKMEEIAKTMQKRFPKVNKKGGFFTRSFYTLYGPSSSLDSLVNEDMSLYDSGFLFYYRFGDGTRFSFTDTYLYFSGFPGESPPSGMSAIKSVSTFYASPVTFPVFRVEIMKMIETGLTPQDGSGSMKIYTLQFMDSNENEGTIMVKWALDGETIYNTMVELINRVVCRNNLIGLAQDKESNLDYESAIYLWERIGDQEKAKDVRRKMLDEKKVEQTVVHGDYVDDRDTIVKDSVINRSNIGAGRKSKAERLREAKALLDDGIIDSDEFKQMKQEILGKKVKKIIKRTKKEILGK